MRSRPTSAPGSYVVRALHHSGREHTYPDDHRRHPLAGGREQPDVGNVTPDEHHDRRWPRASPSTTR